MAPNAVLVPSLVLSLALALLAFPIGAALSPVPAQDADPEAPEPADVSATPEPEAPEPEAAEPEAPDLRDTLKEGNRLFRTGRLDDALETYRAGWNPTHPDSVLAYNLGTTAHHLGRLPEAVLWYRRALDADAGVVDDLWLRNNLERARDLLEAPRLSPPDVSTRLSRHRTALWILGIVTGWVALGLHLVGRRTARKVADVLLVLTALSLAIAFLIPRLAARPAVVLEPCGDGALPAGAEVWIRPRDDGQVSIGMPGGPVTCPSGAVEPIHP